MLSLRSFSTAICSLLFSCVTLAADNPWIVLEGGEGPGKGKHVVLVSGDEEYRSEEALPQLAKILSKHHGFKCTVLFAVDPKTGLIDPNYNSNIPGLEALQSADLLILFTRFRNLPDDQMKHFVDYLAKGKPIIGLRTATHAFNLNKSAYGKFGWQSKEKDWEGGFGRRVLGETWINHHGNHGSQATRGILVEKQKESPILRGIKDGDIFGPTDVYGVRLPLPGDSTPLVLGQVVNGMKTSDGAAPGKKNDPMMPVAWTKSYSTGGKTGKAFTTTMGSAQDISSEGFRRLLVNAAYWAVGLESSIPGSTAVDIVGEYKPSSFKNNGFHKGVKPSDLSSK